MLFSFNSQGGGVSPRAPRRGKKPAPLPPPTHSSLQGTSPGFSAHPVVVEKPVIAEKPPLMQSVSSTSSSSGGDSSYTPLYPSLDRTGSISPVVDRPQVPPPAPPGKPERPEKPALMEKPSSPLGERPKSHPPDRPSVPPPEKPDRPPSITLNDKPEKGDKPEKPDKPERPEKPAKPGMVAGDYGSLSRPGSGRPPRPQPPPPPPPDRKSSLEKQAPLAVAEDDDTFGSTSPEHPKPLSEQTHL